VGAVPLAPRGLGGGAGPAHVQAERLRFSHVVGYAASSSLGEGAVDSLLDAASHGPAGPWHQLVPGRRAGWPALTASGPGWALMCECAARAFPLVGRP
jgi:hypothetical protein